MGKAGSHNNWKYNKKLQGYARDLRNQSTEAEIMLWKSVLRASKLKGYPFRRQRPILNYIVDFMSKDLMLVIEVDGGIHNRPDVIAKDNQKDIDLGRAGFTVLRYTNEEVLTDIDNVIRSLENCINELEASLSTPLAPPPAGE